MRINAKDLHDGARCLRMGDIVYMPQMVHPALWPEIERRLAKEEWVKRILPGASGGYILKLLHLYDRSRSREPEWIEEASDEVKRLIRVESVMAGNRIFENTLIVGYLPLAGFGYHVETGGLAGEVEEEFGCFRLAGVRQLGSIQEPIPEVPDVQYESFEYGHTRLQHIFEVPLISRLIAINLGLSEKEKKLLWIAGQTHDVLTPAGGDTTKLADRFAFDEDRRYEEVFRKVSKKMFAKWGVQPEDLGKIVRGEYPLLSEIQDVADKCAYVARDSAYCLNVPFPRPEEYSEIESIVKRDNLVASIWADVEVRRGRLVFTDISRLERFLRLRALMFKSTYLSIDSRRMSWTVAGMMTKYLYETGRMKEEEFFSQNDRDLRKKVSQVLGNDVDHIYWGRPEAESFTSIESAVGRARSLLTSEEPHLVLMESVKGTTGPATHFLVKQGRKVLPFKDACPKEAERVRDLLTTSHPVRLYHFPVTKLWEYGDKSKIKAVLEHQRKEFKLI